ncbi:phage tail protein [Novispirillum sp. DQ9]|uniref:phage tail protein n=1 Tax=Novispirillum sp. DQ9 TaxID=3398612 RepID=UPI003C79BC64
MLDFYVGMLGIFGFAWAPKGFVTCQGQLLPAAQNRVLQALINNLYGGDGVNTIGIPDLRGRAFIGQGIYQDAQGQQAFQVGNAGGTADTTLTQAAMPPHSHAATFTPVGSPAPLSVSAATDAAETATAAAGSTLAAFQPPNVGPTQYKMYRTSATSNVVPLGGVSGGGLTGGSVTVGTAGAGASFTNMQPYVAMNPCLCLQGLFPPRP